MKKLALIAIAALTMLAACTKEEKISIDNTSWFAKDIYGERQITYNLTLRQGTGNLHIYDYVSSNYNWTIDYRITSYTLNDDGTGTMTFDLDRYDPNWHGPSTHDFDLRVNNTKMGFGNPFRSTTLERIR